MDKQFIKKVRLKDRIATRVITVGGMLVILSVIAILLLIVNVTLPLFMPSRAKLVKSFPIPVAADTQVTAVGIDDYREVGFALTSQGEVRFFTVADGLPLDSTLIRDDGERRVVSVTPLKNNLFSLLWDDRLATLLKVSFTPRFDEQGKRSIEPAVSTVASLNTPQLPAPSKQAQIRIDEEGRITRVDLLADNRFAVTRQATITSLFGDESTEEFFFLIGDNLPGQITAFTLNSAGTALFAGTDRGSLLRWSLSENDSAPRTDITGVTGSAPAITALSMVLGDVSVAVGTAQGGLSTWMPVRADAKSNIKKYRKIHTLEPHRDQIDLIIPSQRNKTLISLSRGGMVHFDHTTSENHLIEVGGDLTLMGADDRGSSLVALNEQRQLQIWSISNPHPEINFATLFTKVWYENYDQPQYVWQSSAGSDDFEPKFSLIPLLFGTIKGTIYAMIFAVPLAIFGAVYTSQFTTPFFKRTVKPVIEIMASIPSVVIGFLIALWLAPIIEQTIIAALLSLVIVPLCFLLFMAAYQPISNNVVWRQRFKGYEFVLLLPAIILSMALANAIGPLLESWLFGGDFKTWLFATAGMHYDQRNCIIIAFGLGIAVIPIIFSITEDAISNIPASLSAASLALGASRWQTVWRVILPSASPGIFAAIMIGFGRVVGETMIVLMATGNTPVLDWSIFNGMRTLSANIAVEIPEAPVGGTLYRVLFLCATLLFCLTFILNTAAEVVRERLRKKYGRY